MQLGLVGQTPDVTVDPTTGGTTTAFVDSSGTPLDTTALDQSTTQAVSQSTDVFGNIDLSKLVDSVAKGYVAVQTAINAGTAPHNTSPVPMPGTVRQLAGGGTMIVNADGSTTVTDAAGNKQTITKSGQVIQGGAPWVDGIPNGTLLLAGIALLGIVMRMGSR
jgi:hypothetical protein